MQVKRHLIQERAADTIRTKIAQGIWPKHLPSERQLAQQLNIGRSTLRKVLDTLTHQNVLKKAQPNKKREIASPPTATHTPTSQRTVAWLSPEPFSDMSQTSLRIIATVKRHLADADVKMNIIHLPTRFAPKSNKHIEQIVQENPAGAWILQSMDLEVRQWFAHTQTPAVVAGGITPSESLNSISIDISLAGADATKKLLDLGHHSIALIQSGRAKADDTKLASIFNSLTTPVQSSVIPVASTPESIPTALEGLFQRKSPPTAIIVDNPRNAVGVVSWLQHHGYKIPQHVSLILLRTQPLIDFCTPKLAHYVFNEEEACFQLSQWTIDLLDKKTLSQQHIQLDATYIPGSSVKAGLTPI
ncbi:substrate-binding domain-containing protein [Rubritalea tangerina]|uniref:Substrate-binding domain-containing protein n=1 Tax=Rubritalea tangerina TaxID=430798 RepID=A0ABW4ZF21_9BACT